MRIFKVFKTQEEIEEDAFYAGLYTMSKQIESMLDLCKELKTSKKNTIELIKRILILEEDNGK